MSLVDELVLSQGNHYHAVYFHESLDRGNYVEFSIMGYMGNSNANLSFNNLKKEDLLNLSFFFKKISDKIKE